MFLDCVNRIQDWKGFEELEVFIRQVKAQKPIHYNRFTWDGLLRTMPLATRCAEI